ncbi:MAG: TIGR01212 family radical SAM protein [Bacteroidetes bacterium]|nr:TIGR01212 family radical SAM protein [Bacteroidota bacterium]
MEFIWGHDRRFNAYSNYLKNIFGERVQKVSIDAGFTCPNRDGSLAVGGCTFCDNDAFNPSYCDPEKSVKQQISEGIEFHQKRYRRANKYLAYFQAYSNTYADIAHLKTLYEEALFFSEVIGLVIGTRPDCISDSLLDYLAELSEKYYIILEFGIESCYDKTLLRINRGHTFQQSVDAIQLTASKGIRTGAHLVFGLPRESREEMLKQAEMISELPINNVKFHQLQIVKNTKMAEEFKHSPNAFDFFDLPDYVEFIIDFLERLNPEIVVERFAGEVPPRFLAGPGWGLIRNDQILNLIEKRLAERDTWQGKLHK